MKKKNVGLETLQNALFSQLGAQESRVFLGGTTHSITYKSTFISPRQPVDSVPYDTNPD